MPRKIGFREAGNIELDGSRRHPACWSRFSPAQTTRTGGRELYRELILNNVASCSVPAPYTHRDLVEQIARQSEKRIPIESVPNSLNRPIGRRGRAIFGFPGDYFDGIARNYDGMRWWVSKKGLNMEVIASEGGEISLFDEQAGRLMFDARSRRLSNGRLPPSEYSKIAGILDRAGFKLQDHLENAFRKKLADWNQRHPNQAVHDFHKALEVVIRLPGLIFLRRGIQKRFNRAESRWEELHKLSAL